MPLKISCKGIAVLFPFIERSAVELYILNCSRTPASAPTLTSRTEPGFPRCLKHLLAMLPL